MRLTEGQLLGLFVTSMGLALLAVVLLSIDAGNGFIALIAVSACSAAFAAGALFERRAKK